MAPTAPFTRIVAPGEFPTNVVGNQVAGDYELSFTATNSVPFNFPGPNGGVGLIVRFFSMSVLDNTCTGVIRGGAASGGGLYGRAFRDPDGTAPWAESDATNVGGIRLTFRRTCRGKPATVVGSSSNERLEGTPGPDVVSGGEGSTEIEGGNGRDVICAEGGGDLVKSGPGKDLVDAGPGNDNVNTGAGRDRIFGGKGRDRCNGGKARDKASGCERALKID
jgi:hypothetical protein